MIHLEAKFNRTQSESYKRALALVPRSVPSITRMAANHGARKGRTEITRQVARKLNLKQASVRKRVSLFTKTRKGGGVGAGVHVDYKPIGLISFNAKQRKKGVRVRVRRGGSIETHRNAFIVRGRGGVQNVFERRGKSRYPLDRKVGPTVKVVLENAPGLLPNSERIMLDAMEKELSRLLDRRLQSL